MNLHTPQVESGIPSKDFQTRKEFHMKALEDAFGIALNAIRNGWQVQKQSTLPTTTRALLQEAERLMKQDASQRASFEAISKLEDPRIRYQVALTFNNLLGGELAKKIIEGSKKRHAASSGHAASWNGIDYLSLCPNSPSSSLYGVGNGYVLGSCSGSAVIQQLPPQTKQPRGR